VLGGKVMSGVEGLSGRAGDADEHWPDVIDD
jgi:hypothetical protein